MPRIPKRLTDLGIKNSKPKEKEYTLFDGGGLCLRIKPNGTRTSLFNYCRPTTGKRANLSLGKYPGISLTKARLLQQEQQGLLGQGLDPAEEDGTATTNQTGSHQPPEASVSGLVTDQALIG